MDKKLLKMLKELNEVLENSLKDDTKSFVLDKINEAFKEETVISINKKENGEANTHIKGSSLAVLITLAGLEKTIFEKLDVPKDLWELIKNVVGTREAEDNE